MNPQSYTTQAFLALLLLVSFRGSGQHDRSAEAAEDKLKIAAREIITSANTCALITLDREGNPRARMMDHFPPEDDFTLWFGTNPDSRKVAQIRNDPRVNLYYPAVNHSGYVTINGTAELIDDQKEKEKRGKAAWEEFYPAYPDGYMLIKVTPVRMEVVSYPHGIVGDTITWEPPAVNFRTE
jgi:general stress protein 26